MNRAPYSPYHGRKSPLRRVLTVVVVLLVIALVLALAALFILPNYIVYTPDGPRLADLLEGNNARSVPRYLL